MIRDMALFLLLAFAVWVSTCGVSGLFLSRSLRGNIAYDITNTGGQALSRLQDADTTRNVDILVIGSSHAYRGFDPRIFSTYDLRVFNLGSSSQTPVQIHYLLKRYLDQLQPKLLIIEAFPQSLNINGLGSALDLVPKTPFSWDKLEMAVTIDQVQLYNSIAANAWDSFLGITPYEEITEPRERWKDTYIHGGYVSTTREAYDGELDRAFKYYAKAYQYNALSQSIEMARERKIPVAMIEAPVSEVWYEQVVARKLLRTQLSELPVDAYWNWNEKVSSPYPDSLFYDPHHLRQPGVDRFNHELIPELMEQFPFLKN